MDETREFIDDIMDRNRFFIDVRLILYNKSEDVYTFEINYCDEFVQTYQVDRTRCLIYCYNETDVGEEPTSGEAFFVAAYLMRLFLLSSIIAEVRKQKLSLSIVRFYDAKSEKEKRVETLHELIPLLDGDAIAENEKYADGIISAIWSDKALLHAFDDELKSKNMYNNFLIIKGILA